MPLAVRHKQQPRELCQIMPEFQLSSRNHLHALVWLAFPLVMLATIYLSRYFYLPFYLEWVEGEHGAIENLTALFLLPTILLGILLLTHRDKFPRPYIAIWFLLHGLGALYFAGEEISWGQHFFGWATPEAVDALNDQGETNLHNMTSWLDQKPRLLLVFWAVIGGLILPLLHRLNYLAIGGRDDWRYWIIPPAACMPAAIIVMLVRLPEEIAYAFDRVVLFPFDVRSSEVQELYLALFLSVYLISVYRRAKAAPVFNR